MIPIFCLGRVLRSERMVSDRLIMYKNWAPQVSSLRPGNHKPQVPVGSRGRVARSRSTELLGNYWRTLQAGADRTLRTGHRAWRTIS